MKNFAKENWFKLAGLATVLILGVLLIYHSGTEQKQKYSYRKIQDSEILAVVPTGYHLAQIEDGKNDVNYIQAHLEDTADDEVVLILESDQYQVGLNIKSPVIVKVLKYSHESDRWLEYAKTALQDDSNIKFSYRLIDIDGDKNDKIVLFPFIYSLNDMYFDDSGNPTGVKPEATMHQAVAILQLKDGGLADMIRYGHGGPMIDNVTADGGSDSGFVGADGSLIFANYVKPLGASWKGCYPIQYQRFFFKKDAAEFLTPNGAFMKYDEFITKQKYTNDGARVAENPMVDNNLEKCSFIIYGGSAMIDENQINAIPLSFMQTPKDTTLVTVKGK
ncbi:MAG: hypothetical protein WCG07_00820 [Candidatus Taylorbacteria bacterium]